MAQKTTAKKAPAEDPRYTQAVQNYEAGLRAMQDRKFEKARTHLQKVLDGPKELADRARVHLRIVEQRMAKQPAPSVRTPEEHYQAGVAMMNLGRWDEARDHLLRARKLAPKADTFSTRWRRWIV